MIHICSEIGKVLEAFGPDWRWVVLCVDNKFKSRECDDGA